MAMPKKGARKINVDGTQYLWKVRRRPTYAQGLGKAPLTVAVECAESPGATLVLSFPFARPDSWVAPRVGVATPENVACGIRQALQAGWTPDAPGAAFEVEVADS